MNSKKILAFVAAAISSSAFAVNGAQHYTPVVNETGILTLHSSSYGEATKLGIGLNYNLAVDPEEYYSESRGKLKNWVHSLNVGVGSRLSKRFHVYGDFSAHYLNPVGANLDTALGNDSNFVFGNIDVGGGFSILDNSDGGLGIGVTAHVVAPVGTENAYLDGPSNGNSKRDWQYGAVVAVDYRLVHKDLLLINVGYDRRAQEDYLLWGVGYQKAVWGSENHNILFELRGVQNFDDPKTRSTDGISGTDSLEADIAYKGYCRNRRGSYTVGIGRGFNNDVGSPDLRVMLGTSLQFGADEHGAIEEPKAEEPAKEEPKAAPAPAPVSEAPAAAPVVEKVVAGVTTLKVSKIYFANNKDEILEKSFPALDKFAKDLTENPGLKIIQIGGYTDNVGDAAYNVDLSQRRANSVKKYLVDKGIDEKRLTTKGYGPENPVADNATSAGRASNRRVEFLVVQVDGEIRMDVTD